MAAGAVISRTDREAGTASRCLTGEHRSEPERQPDRAVIRSGHAALDAGISDVTLKLIRDKEIIDSPSHVLLAGAHAVGPPAVLIRHVPVHPAEGVYVAGRHEAVEEGALLREKAGVLLVELGPCKVNRLMCDIEISADHHGLLLAELSKNPIL